MSNVFDRMLEELDQEVGPLNAPDSSASHSDSPTDSESPQDVQPQNLVGTSIEVKQVAQELLKQGYLEESKRPDLFRRAILRQADVQSVLEPLDLAMKVDSHRGIAFLVTTLRTANHLALESAEQAEDEEWGHPLVRRQRLTLEQSLLIAILRQAFVMHEQESGVGSRDAVIAVEDLLPQFLVYMKDSGSDSKNESRLLHLLDQLKTYGIVSEVDKKQEIVIRPLIAHLANPESLTALLHVLTEKAKENLSDESSTVVETEC
jgi:hypothetical protein